jgi:ligand-binding sensor domain-containing protein/signal transduction histidine kinase
MSDSGQAGCEDRRRRHVPVMVIALATMLLACTGALALNPALDVSQYGHTSWKSRDGFAQGQITAIVQTPDGYLWLGTRFGLLRFDGVRLVSWRPPSDQHLPSDKISKLLAARDGTLWIGTWNGLASWRNGKLSQYPELAGWRILGLLEDHEGTLWASAYGTPEDELCEIRNGGVRCQPVTGGNGRGLYGLHEDRGGNLWVGLETVVSRWKPGPPKFYAVPGESNGIQGMADGEDRALLIGATGGVRRIVDGKAEMAYPFPATMRGVHCNEMHSDRDGALWVGTSGGGLVHIHQGRTDVFSVMAGLTGDGITALFEDREGSIWVGTTNGLDRFRELPVVTYSVNQGLSSAANEAVLAARDGSIWFSADDGLNRLNHGQATVYRQPGGQAARGIREIAVSGLPRRALGSLFQDSRGRVWVSSQSGIGYLENDRFISVAAPGGIVRAMTEDTAGNLWIANQDLGLIRLSPLNQVQRIPWAILGRKDSADALAADPLQGGMWLGFVDGGIAYFQDGQVRTSYSDADGLAKGRVNDLRFDEQGALWAATEGGLSRLKNGRIATLTSKNGTPCDAVQWTIADNRQSVWMMMPCGLVRVARSDWDEWAANPARILKTVFDSSEGVGMHALAGDFSPQAAKSPDGRLWFTAPDGISVVDPGHLPFNNLPPPVHIEQITADHRSRRTTLDRDGTIRLPALVRLLEIDYTGLSLVAPEKVLFRYKLEGFAPDWTDADNRRQTSYSNLPPGKYRFRVSACNNSGVWNEAGAFLDFAIAPAFYQTTWFGLACLAALSALLGVLYRLRMLQLARQFNVRLEERVNERTRIARDLHDTLLQTIQGSKIVAEDALDEQADPVRMRRALESVLEWLGRAVEEGREALNSLRSSTTEENALAEALRRAGEEFQFLRSIDFHLAVEGAGQEMHPIVRDEVYRIGYEAIRNACVHSGGNRLTVELSYAKSLTLSVKDNGKGIDPDVAANGKSGHFGLIGMYERARRIRGKLTISSSTGLGTEVKLVVPRKIAFLFAPPNRPNWYLKIRRALGGCRSNLGARR